MVDPQTIAASRAVAHQFKSVVDSMFEDSKAIFHKSLSALKGSLSHLQSFVDRADREYSLEHSAKVPEGGQVSPERVARRRSGGRFAIAEFVLGELSKSAKPMRPVEIAARLSEETGRTKKSAIANINTLLSRLRQAKRVTSKNGLYSVTETEKASTATTLQPKSKGTRSGRPRGGKRFATGDFILNQLKSNPNGMRPTDIANALSKAAPGKHKNTVSVTNTTLARQLSVGQVRKIAPGIWAIASASSGAVRIGKKRGRPKKTVAA